MNLMFLIFRELENKPDETHLIIFSTILYTNYENFLFLLRTNNAKTNTWIKIDWCVPNSIVRLKVCCRNI